MLTPKGHPEIAGCGIEYCWGKAKYEFRNHYNKQQTAPGLMEKAVRASMASEGSTTRENVKRYVKKNYERMRCAICIHT